MCLSEEGDAKSLHHIRKSLAAFDVITLQAVSKSIDTSPASRLKSARELPKNIEENAMADESAPKFDTLAVHAGAAPDPSTGARATPIYQTSSFVFNDADHAAALFGLEAFGNIYTRIGNPTQAVLEERIAALEGGTAALAVASGHAAEFLTFHTLLEQGDQFIAGRQLYGGSVNQFNHAYKKFGWDVAWADATDPSSFEAAITDKTRAIFIESIANPGGLVVDIPAIAAVAKKAGVPLIVDNTMATPYLCRPIEHGADIVIHSLTKFIGGQGNSIGGIIVDCGTYDWLGSKHNYKTLVEPNASYGGMRLAETFGNLAFAIACRVMGLRDLGPAIAPMNAFLILNGVETLSLRMDRHCSNAKAVAEYLSKHPKVDWVNYAGLPDHPNHAMQKKISPKGAGAVFTFGLKGGYDAGVQLVSSLNLFSHLANIGDTRSLVIHPASTTHRQLTDEQRVAAGAGPEVIRLSVGIEDKDDIIADLEQALAQI
jgi:O-acetylhomoserine (thiol)-lyase